MTALELIPDGEKLVSDLLRGHPALQALDARFVGKTPDDVTRSWVRVSELDSADEPKSTAEFLIGYLLQFDCYAGSDGGQPEAKLLARTVRAVLRQLPEGERPPGAVITSVRFPSMIRLPDDAFKPARERVVLSATVHMHRAA